MSKEIILVLGEDDPKTLKEFTEEVIQRMTVKFMEENTESMWCMCTDFCSRAFREGIGLQVTDKAMHKLVAIAHDRSVETVQYVNYLENNKESVNHE